MIVRVLDPTHEGKTPGGKAAPRPISLEGKTVGIITNAKEGTKGFFTHLDRMLREELHVGEVLWRQKSNYSAPADAHIIEDARRWHAAVTGVGD